MIRVIGVGHALGGDDYIGIKVVEELSGEIDSDEVEFVTTNDPSRIIYLAEDSEKMVIVDAVLADEPGKVFVVDQDSYPKYLKPISSHGFEVPFAIEVAKKMGFLEGKKVVIVGISVENIQIFEEKISDVVLRAIPEAKRTVRELIEKL
jgi:hydrogenase maturation protease